MNQIVKEPLRLLMVEDSDSDELLVLRALKKQGFEVQHLRVEDAEAMGQALELGPWDMVLSDFSLPQFSAPEALRLMQARGLDLPFIVVSATVGEAVAVDTMRAGAHDYLMKGHLARLGEAVRREIASAVSRKERREAKSLLIHLNRVLQSIRRINQLIVREKDPDQLIQQACEMLVETRGYRTAWIIRGDPEKSPIRFGHAGCADSGLKVESILTNGSTPSCVELAAASESGLVALNPAIHCQQCPLWQHSRFECAACVELRHDDKKFGVLTVAISETNAVGEEEESLLLEISGDLAFALHALEVESDREEALGQSQSLLQAARAVLLEPDLPTAARTIFDICAAHLGAPAGYCALLSEDGQENEVLFLESGGRPCSVDPDLPMPIRGLREIAYKEHRAVFENNFQSSPYWELMPAHHAPLDNVLFAPLILDGEAVGLLGLANRPGGFEPRHARMAEAFAEITAVALREHRTREALRSSEAQYRTLFDSAADAIMTLAPPSWRFTSGNPATIQLFGVKDEAEFVSRAPWEYSPPRQPDGRDSADKAREMIQIAMDQGSHLFDWQHKQADGPSFPATVLLARMELNGEPLLQATVRDMTEVRRMQTQIAQADRLSSMGMLAAGVAHEINNPLSYVLYNIESLSEDLPDLLQEVHQLQLKLTLLPDQVAAEAGLSGLHPLPLVSPVSRDDILTRFKDALGGIYRIRDIARGLGTFSRVERNNPVPVHLMHVIEVAINMAFNEIKYRARLVKDFGRTPMVLASEGRLSQVFLNLIINATHALTEGDVENNEIRIRTWTEGEQVCAEVRDTGTGIPAENLEKLFEPFFTTKEIGVGSGLGLAISRNIIESYSGSISVQSEVGVGTCFTIRLPALQHQVKGAEAAPAPTLPAGIRGRILVVDDEPGICQAVARILKEHEVVQSNTGSEAKGILELDSAFDLVLCDMMMPETSGMDLHRWLTEHHPRLAAQFIFMTGGAFTPRARDYLSKVDNIRLDKPIDVSNLKKIVGELIRASKNSGDVPER